MFKRRFIIRLKKNISSSSPTKIISINPFIYLFVSFNEYAENSLAEMFCRNGNEKMHLLRMHFDSKHLFGAALETLVTDVTEAKGSGLPQ